jgi:transcription elongation GreA/GreB family factor
MKKAEIIERITDVLKAELEAVEASAAAAREGATHEEAKPENEYDTRGLEQSYLAGAQTARADALVSSIANLLAQPVVRFDADRPVAAGALVTLDDGEEEEIYFVGVEGGGVRVEHGGKTIRVITPGSPLGSVLLGKTVGDTVELRIRDKVRELELVSVE